jgi:ATP/maltotriose-dependent transcriptional regulator MalT
VFSKTTRPRLHTVLARERLFATLDQARTRPLVWICGPPGSGKSVLAATYVEANKLPAAWYQLDTGDADLATFFYFLRAAVTPIAKKRRSPLPLLTSEFAADPLGFARRYVRELAQRLPETAVLVFDNYHEIAIDSALHDVLVVAQEELPPDVNMLVISRTDPPPQLARALANERVSLVDWPALQLDLEETAKIAALRGERNARAISDLYQQTGGWAAGLTLLLESSRRAQPAFGQPLSESRETVFGYFAEQVFKDAKTETRDILVRTAFLPRFTAQAAQQLTGNPRAASLLDELYRRRLFTDRRGSQQVSYHYHDLFREFLQGQARQTYAATGLRDLQQRSAAVLAVEGQIEAAFPLYCVALDWNAAVTLLLGSAGQLVAQGRWKILSKWIDALPAAAVEDARASRRRSRLRSAVTTKRAALKRLLRWWNLTFSNIAISRRLTPGFPCCARLWMASFVSSLPKGNSACSSRS